MFLFVLFKNLILLFFISINVCNFLKLVLLLENILFSKFFCSPHTQHKLVCHHLDQYILAERCLVHWSPPIYADVCNITHLIVRFFSRTCNICCNICWQHQKKKFETYFEILDGFYRIVFSLTILFDVGKMSFWVFMRY